jgi:hypothetical protein
LKNISPFLAREIVFLAWGNTSAIKRIIQMCIKGCSRLKLIFLITLITSWCRRSTKSFFIIFLVVIWNKPVSYLILELVWKIVVFFNYFLKTILFRVSIIWATIFKRRAVKKFFPCYLQVSHFWQFKWILISRGTLY